MFLDKQHCTILNYAILLSDNSTDELIYLDYDIFAKRNISRTEFDLALHDLVEYKYLIHQRSTGIGAAINGYKITSKTLEYANT